MLSYYPVLHFTIVKPCITCKFVQKNFFLNTLKNKHTNEQKTVFPVLESLADASTVEDSVRTVEL